MSVQIQMRRGTAAQWTTANTLLAEGEIGLELDTQKFKMGTGLLAWDSLPYYDAGSSSESVTSVSATSPLASTGGTTPTLSIPASSSTINGYLSSIDWNTFNGKQAALGFTPYNATNPAGYISSYTETDPIFVASPSYAITTTKISNWDTAYSWGNHASVGYLDGVDIGTSVQAYNANTVVDASYVHTDNNYTTTEKTKLSGIATGAEVNVNADWTAATGDAVILNKPTLGTAAATDSTDYATAAQGTLANSALQSAAIGVTIQAYDSDLAGWAGIATTAKQDTLVSGTNLKSINGSSLLGSGTITLFSGGLVTVAVVTVLPGSPDANTLYIVTG